MKILFITDNFPPEVNAPASRTFEHCLEWTNLGADITVITCAPNFPHGKVYPGYKNKMYQTEHIKGIKVIRVWSFITANEGFLKRIIDYMSFAFSSFIAGLFQKTHIIIATSPQFFTLFSGFGLSKIKRRPWIFELRDIWPESIKAVGAMNNGLILKALEKIELFFYKDAVKVIALTDAFKENLSSRGVPGEKIEVVTNGSNSTLFAPREKSSRLMKDLNLQGKFVIGYIGAHGMAHGLEQIVSSLENVKDEKIHFFFIGDGARKKEIIRLAEEKKLSNITFLGLVPREEVPEYISVIDASLVSFIKADTFKRILPSKIFEAVAMQKPVLLGLEGHAKELIEKYNAGLCFEPENGQDLLEKIILLKNDQTLYRDLQTGCLRLASDYDRKQLAELMYSYLTDIDGTNNN